MLYHVRTDGKGKHQSYEARFSVDWSNRWENRIPLGAAVEHLTGYGADEAEAVANLRVEVVRLHNALGEMLAGFPPST